MKVSTENDNNFGYEKITILVDNMHLSNNHSIKWTKDDISIQNHVVVLMNKSSSSKQIQEMINHIYSAIT
jgi:hypothetical protein